MKSSTVTSFSSTLEMPGVSEIVGLLETDSFFNAEYIMFTFPLPVALEAMDLLLGFLSLATERGGIPT